MGVTHFKFDDSSSPCIPEPDETPEPDDTVDFVEPKKLDEKIVVALNDAANFYNDFLMSNEDRFKHIWDYLARRGVGKDTISKFNIGYAPPYSDEGHQGRGHSQPASSHALKRIMGPSMRSQMVGWSDC